MARPVVHRTVTWSTTTEQLTPGNTRAVAVVGDAHADTTVVLPAGPKLLCHAQHNAQAHTAHKAQPHQQGTVVHTYTISEGQGLESKYRSSQATQKKRQATHTPKKSSTQHRYPRYVHPHTTSTSTQPQLIHNTGTRNMRLHTSIEKQPAHNNHCTTTSAQGAPRH